MYRNTKLVIMPILPTLCVCEKPESRIQVKAFLRRQETLVFNALMTKY